jgi:hypothetical protein
MRRNHEKSRIEDYIGTFIVDFQIKTKEIEKYKLENEVRILLTAQLIVLCVE